MRIVIAEDSVLLREGLRKLMGSHHIDVVATVADADALLRAVEQHRPDLALIDVRMPPPGLELTATTTAGIAVDGLTGPADLTCSAGPVVVTGAGGPVTARTDSGGVDVSFTRPRRT